MTDRIKVDLDGGVADVRLVRADKMNALDEAMFSALVDTGERLKQDKRLRAIVLSGEGRAFCAGLDRASFSRMAEAGAGSGVGGMTSLAARTHGPANRAQQAVWVWRTMPVPVIAAVHGAAFGGGFQLCLGADMRYVHPTTQLSVTEIKWGLVPDMAGTRLMRHLARDDVVRELTYTGRVFSGEEAFVFGFATRLCDDPHAEAMSVARDIAQKSPDAIRAAKRLLNAAPGLDDAAGLLMESVEQEKLLGAANQIEAILANRDGRAPRFAEPAA